MSEIAWISIGALVFFGLFAFVRFARRAEEEVVRELEQTVEEELAKVLHRKLELPKERVLQTLRTGENPEIRELLSEVVKDVSISFQKADSNGKYEASISILLNSGSRTRVSWPVEWDELPAPVREEFIRTGKSEVVKPWLFPWDTSEEGDRPN